MRVLEGVGNSAATLSSISIMAETFPHNLGLVMSTVEVFAGLGGILGPFIGGALFKFGGYIYPFYFCGVFQLITLVVCIFTIKSTDKDGFGKLNWKLNWKTYWKLLKFKSIMLCCMLTGKLKLNFWFPRICSYVRCQLRSNGYRIFAVFGRKIQLGWISNWTMLRPKLGLDKILLHTGKLSDSYLVYNLRKYYTAKFVLKFNSR